MTPRELYPGLFVSGHTRGLDPIQTIAILKWHGISHVVCVAPREDKELAIEMKKNNDFYYEHVPLSDGKTIPAQTIRGLARDLEKALQVRKILIHCNAGRNRSPFIAALIMIYRGLSPEEAISTIRASRNSALANQYFVDFLLKEKA